MSRWWRAYDEAVDDPKLILLSDKAHRTWFNLMCVASLHEGVLPDIKIVAVKLRIPPQRAAAALTELVKAGLFDQREDGRFEPHNWSGRQYKSDVTDPTNATRQKRHRDKLRNTVTTVTDTVTVTPPREQNTEAETEQKERTRAVAPSDGWPNDYGDQFWQAYPRKTEKIAAMKKLAAVRKSGIVTFPDLMTGVHRYAALKTEPQFTKHPTSWLNAGCWADETQPGATNGNRPHNSNGRPASGSFFDGLRSLAEDIAGDGKIPRPADEEIPRGRFEIDG